MNNSPYLCYVKMIDEVNSQEDLIKLKELFQIL
jgi:hypothetical protein